MSQQAADEMYFLQCFAEIILPHVSWQITRYNPSIILMSNLIYIDIPITMNIDMKIMRILKDYLFHNDLSYSTCNKHVTAIVRPSRKVI